MNQQKFSYGSIKPDLPFEYNCHHTLENCIFKVLNTANRLMDERLSVDELSVELGEICHYLCDFFCYYHLNEEIHNKKMKHFFYEIKLHYEIYKSYPNRKYMILPSKQIPRRDISSIIFEMRRAYYLQPQEMKCDLEFAIITATWICESIIFFKNKSVGILSEPGVPLMINKLS